jgi:hypothetical protein
VVGSKFALVPREYGSARRSQINVAQITRGRGKGGRYGAIYLPETSDCSWPVSDRVISRPPGKPRLVPRAKQPSV